MKKMTIAYIAHPIGGDVKNNIDKVIAICREINLNEPNVVPFVPYLSDLYALDDTIPEERERGIKNGLEVLDRNIVDEVRLYGDRISFGMRQECIRAFKNQIFVRPMTPETTKQLHNPEYL